MCAFFVVWKLYYKGGQTFADIDGGWNV